MPERRRPDGQHPVVEDSVETKEKPRGGAENVQVAIVFIVGMVSTLLVMNYLQSPRPGSPLVPPPIPSATAPLPEQPAPVLPIRSQQTQGAGLNPSRALRPLSSLENPFGVNSAKRPSTPNTQAAGSRPNIIFLLADDLGWGDVNKFAALGEETAGAKARTPVLDRMMEEGTAFTSFYVMSPVCSPSRATFLTGQWPTAKYLRTPYIYAMKPELNRARGQADYMNSSLPTVASILKGAGYTTAHFGKWHLGGTPDAPSLGAYGFDESSAFGCNPSAVTETSTLLTETYPPFKDPMFPAASSRLIATKTVDFIKKAESEGKPFYVNVWFHIAHAPLNPSAAQLAPFPQQQYCPASGIFPGVYVKYFTTCPIQAYHASLLDLDTQIGVILDAVRESKKLSRNTLVVYTSDNGPEDESVYFNAKGSTGPFRGRKRSLYEGGIRTPFIAWWPGTIPAGRVSGADVASVDWLPTVAALGGAPLPPALLRGRCDEGMCLGGRDMTALLIGAAQTVPRSIPLVWDFRYKINGPCANQSPRLAIREGPLKLLMHHDLSRVELYNTTTDLSEQLNIADQHPTKVEQMAAKLMAWLRTQAPTDRPELNPGCYVENRKLLRAVGPVPPAASTVHYS